MKITKPNITPGPWHHGYDGPYIIAGTRPASYATAKHVVTYGELTGGFGWPDARDPENEYGLTPEAMEANAKAIAVVPELIDFLIEVQKVFPSSEGYKLLEKAGCVVTSQ